MGCDILLLFDLEIFPFLPLYLHEGKKSQQRGIFRGWHFNFATHYDNCDCFAFNASTLPHGLRFSRLSQIYFILFIFWQLRGLSQHQSWPIEDNHYRASRQCWCPAPHTSYCFGKWSVFWVLLWDITGCEFPSLECISNLLLHNNTTNWIA